MLCTVNQETKQNKTMYLRFEKINQLGVRLGIYAGLKLSSKMNTIC